MSAVRIYGIFSGICSIYGEYIWRITWSIKIYIFFSLTRILLSYPVIDI